MGLVLVFAAPGVAAYVFYTHPSWLGSAPTNKGNLLKRAVELGSIEKNEKWRLVLWTPSSCTTSCLQQLDKLARVRLALGRKLYLVEQMLLIDGKPSRINAQAKTNLKNNDVAIQVLSSIDKERLEQLSKTPQIFIMDPENYLILSYQVDVKPEDLYKDLKLLLGTYETKKG